jgi:hypothetical protein
MYNGGDFLFTLEIFKLIMYAYNKILLRITAW